MFTAILVSLRATNLDFHNKIIYTRDLTYLHNDLQMFRVYHDEALVTLKKIDENESNLETYENHASEERCWIVNIMQGFDEFKIKKVFVDSWKRNFYPSLSGHPNVKVLMSHM